MSTPDVPENFIELNDHALIAARVTTIAGQRTITALREIPLQNRVEVAEALRTVFPGLNEGEPVPVACTLRPVRRFLRCANADEATKHQDASAVHAQVTAGAEGGAEAWNVVSSGAPGKPWVACAAARESIDASLALLREWNFAPVRAASSSLGLLGTLRGAAQTKDASVLVWDASATSSDLVLAGVDGADGVRRLDFGFDGVVEALLAEIQLKFKGAAVRLFFNERYDFSECGPKIAARVAAALRPKLDELSKDAGHAPGAFWCAGLPAKQMWFAQQLAAALELRVWQPDLAAWAHRAGLAWANEELRAALAPSNVALLDFVATPAAPATSSWLNTVVVAETPPAVERLMLKKPVPSAPAGKAVPATLAGKPVPTEPARPVKVAAPMSFARTAVGGLDAVRPLKRVPVEGASKREETEARTKPIGVPSLPGHEKADSLVLRALAKTEDAPAETITSAPAVEVPAEEIAPVARTARPRSKLTWWIGGAVAASVLAIGTIQFVQYVEAEKAAAAREKAIAEQRIAAAEEAQRLADLKAREEAEALRQAEALAAQQQREAEEAQVREQEAARLRQMEAERLLSVRSAMEIQTNPAGAVVRVGDGATNTTPVVVSDLPLGLHLVQISLEGYERMEMQVEVRENKIASPGVVTLTRQTGAMIVGATPAPANYTVRPAGVSFSLGGSDVLSGRTPATLSSLPTGAYEVTLERAGWPAVTKTVMVANRETVNVSEGFPGGTVRVTSIPTGADVLRDGVMVGRTPFTLTDVTPGEISLQLIAGDHHPTTVRGKVVGGQSIDLLAGLVQKDRMARSDELESPPKAITTVQPVLADATQFAGQRVLISVMVDVDGTPHDWRVESTPDEQLGDLCIEAIAQWRFEPGRVGGQPAKVRVTVPFIITAK